MDSPKSEFHFKNPTLFRTSQLSDRKFVSISPNLARPRVTLAIRNLFSQCSFLAAHLLVLHGCGTALSWGSVTWKGPEVRPAWPSQGRQTYLAAVFTAKSRPYNPTAALSATSQTYSPVDQPTNHAKWDLFCPTLLLHSPTRWSNISACYHKTSPNF